MSRNSTAATIPQIKATELDLEQSQVSILAEWGSSDTVGTIKRGFRFNEVHQTVNHLPVETTMG